MGFCDKNFFKCQIQRTEKIQVFSKGTDDSSKYLKYEALYIANYEYVNISSFAVLDIQFWLEEDGDLNADPLYIHSIKDSKLIQNAVII